MLAPELSTKVHSQHGHITLRVVGPLATAEHASALLAACLDLDDGRALVVNLSGITILTETGVRGLRDLARTMTADGRTVVFVCAELILRAELLLGDLDRLAPVLQADEQAVAVVSRAA